MPTCQHVIEAAAADGQHVADTITLDETDRRRRRLLLESDGGIEIMLDLPAVRLLRDGDLLVLDDERLVRVAAQGEALYEVRGSDDRAMLTLVWHIGNRHLPTQVCTDHVRIRADPVIRTMLLQLGARISEVQAGFDPEGGAYGGAGGHDPGHDHGHDHGQGHEHDPAHAHSDDRAGERGADAPSMTRRQPGGSRSRARRL